MSTSDSWLSYVTRTIISFGAAVGAAYISMRMVAPFLNPMSKREQQWQRELERFRRRCPQYEHLEFNEYEMSLLTKVTLPDDLEVSFTDIGGLEHVKDGVHEAIIMRTQSAFINRRSSLMQAPKGILFYGPPGTGKTMMAKAIARDTGLAFIDVNITNLLDKWMGESQKFVAAVFSLARKLAPCIVFVDEVDNVLSNRGSTHGPGGQTYDSVTGIFLQCWDGLYTEEHSQVIVLAASNRPQDLDPAVLRRLPRTYEFRMPDTNARKSILQRLLRDEVLSNEFNMDTLAGATEGYSGSDLTEMAKYAAMIPVREAVREFRKKQQQSSGGGGGGNDVNNDNNSSNSNANDYGDVKLDHVRPLTLQDFAHAMKHVPPTGVTALLYGQQQQLQH